MTKRDDIDKDVIETYRVRKAPAGLAARVTQAADSISRPRTSRLRWVAPAFAMAVLIVAVVVLDTAPDDPYALSVAVSLSDIPTRSLTISTRRIGRLPSLASVRPLPRAPKFDLDFSDLKAKTPSATKRRATTTLPN